MKRDSSFNKTGMHLKNNRFITQNKTPSINAQVYRQTEPNSDMGRDIFDSPEPKRQHFDIELNSYTEVKTVEMPWLAQMPIKSEIKSPGKLASTHQLQSIYSCKAILS